MHYVFFVKRFVMRKTMRPPIGITLYTSYALYGSIIYVTDVVFIASNFTAWLPGLFVLLPFNRFPPDKVDEMF